MLIGFIAFMAFMALILAWWEIQIEGKDGWAAKSPGWKIDKGWLMRLTGGLPVTGYHVFKDNFHDHHRASAFVLHKVEFAT